MTGATKLINMICQPMLRTTCVFLFLILTTRFSNAQSLMLIAHRGGVVDSSYTENGRLAMKGAVREGYQMIEVDVRVSNDGVLLANHDADFKRYYGVDKKVVEMPWAGIAQLKSTLDGNVPMRLDEVLQFCKANKLGVMLDNKIAGMDSVVFQKLVDMLDRFQLRNTALMIGTEESTNYFTGKIRLSCSRKQLESNMQKPGYDASHYFLFERPANLRKEDVDWAQTHEIVTVAAINKFHYRKSADMMTDAGNDCRRMLGMGVKNFQIDSEFGKFLSNKGDAPRK
jgi:glycerophosphoryl diester phosphodiesterase